MTSVRRDVYQGGKSRLYSHWTNWTIFTMTQVAARQGDSNMENLKRCRTILISWVLAPLIWMGEQSGLTNHSELLRRPMQNEGQSLLLIAAC